MGAALRKMFDRMFGNKEMRVRPSHARDARALAGADSGAPRLRAARRAAPRGD